MGWCSQKKLRNPLMNQNLPKNLRTATKAAAQQLLLAVKQPQIRVPLLILLHTVIFSLIYAFSFAARYDFALPKSASKLLLDTLPAIVIVKIGVFYFGRHFHGWWRYVTFADLSSLLRVSLFSMLMIAFVDYFFLLFETQIPRLSILLDTLLTIVVVGGLRCSLRFFDERVNPIWQNRVRKPAIMVGAGHSVGQLAAQINSNNFIELRITAMVSHETRWHPTIFSGVPVAGLSKDIAEIAKKYRATDVLVPTGLLSGRDLRQLVQNCNANELKLRVLPRMEDALQGSAKIPLRPLAINDLLKREPVVLDTDRLVKLIRGKRILVTGAGGSIGSEICRQLLGFAPTELILLGRGENRIHAIHLELQATANDAGVKLTQAICSITDEPGMRRVFETARPDIVFHAAAHKHVPLMELHVGEAVKNNINGTSIVAALADEFSATHFVMVSSDKAVNPTSVMGCTKHLAERVVNEFAQTSETRFVVVRFGNVLGSAGSVIPIFQQQIEQGGPITITDSRMTRFFMSIPEAAQLVMQSAAMCKGGEIYVLDMGEAVSIVQLAEDLVSLGGLPPGSIEFEFTGVRSGEKLYEELYFDDEMTLPTEHGKVRAARPRVYEDISIHDEVKSLLQLVDSDSKIIRRRLAELVPSYASNTDPKSSLKPV